MTGTLKDVLAILPDLKLASAEHDEVWFESKFKPNHAYKDPDGDEDGEGNGIEPDEPNPLTVEQTKALDGMGVHWDLDGQDYWHSFT